MEGSRGVWVGTRKACHPPCRKTRTSGGFGSRDGPIRRDEGMSPPGGRGRPAGLIHGENDVRGLDQRADPITDLEIQV